MDEKAQLPKNMSLGQIVREIVDIEIDDLKHSIPGGGVLDSYTYSIWVRNARKRQDTLYEEIDRREKEYREYTNRDNLN